MLTGHNLVYYAPGEWNGLWRNRHQLMSVFARQNQVLFIERRLHLRPTVAGFRRGDLGFSDVRRSRIRRISDGLYVFRYPVWAPVCGRLDQLAKLVRRLSVRDALRRLHMSQPIVWFSYPSMTSEIGEIQSPRLRLYHVVDEYSAYSGQTTAGRRRVERREREMLALADAVIVVSEKLYNAKRPFNANTYLVPNAVSFQAYDAALADPYIPGDLRVIKRPRLGYIGLIGDKLDFDMLAGLARQNPEWSLVLLGHARVSQQTEMWRALKAMSNVHHLGPVDASQVPQYVKGFQIGLMPYVQNRHAEHIDPLKMYEYLAAGLPVASVDIPAARRFEPLIHLASRPQDFAQAVRAALADVSVERREARRRAASHHTWEARVERLSELIETQLKAGASRN